MNPCEQTRSPPSLNLSIVLQGYLDRATSHHFTNILESSNTIQQFGTKGLQHHGVKESTAASVRFPGQQCEKEPSESRAAPPGPPREQCAAHDAEPQPDSLQQEQEAT